MPALLLGVLQPGVSAGQPRASQLHLVVEDESGASTGVALECDPAGGTHPRADEACAVLTETNGDAAAVSYSEDPCVLIYRPVHARLIGHWQGRAVRYAETFPNRCVMRTEKGPLFDF
ncbi:MULTISPECIES: SSI family serine proteinase inhibitor [Thermocrispum]|jgi:hypothetical protein|nr:MULTISPECIES: SSI family serine proteinase inhibitor [Thermocrispum]